MSRDVLINMNKVLTTHSPPGGETLSRCQLFAVLGHVRSKFAGKRGVGVRVATRVRVTVQATSTSGITISTSFLFAACIDLRPGVALQNAMAVLGHTFAAESEPPRS